MISKTTLVELPPDVEIGGKNLFTDCFGLETGKDSISLHLKSHVSFVAHIFEYFTKISIKD